MSDRELVSFDAAQFAKLDLRLEVIGNVLWSINDYLKKSGDTQVLTAVNNLSRKVEEFMSTQETRLQGIQNALTSIADGVNTLQQQIADLKANNPELEDEISGMEATVKAIGDDISGVVSGGEGGGGTEGGGTA